MIEDAQVVDGAYGRFRIELERADWDDLSDETKAAIDLLWAIMTRVSRAQFLDQARLVAAYWSVDSMELQHSSVPAGLGLVVHSGYADD